MEDHTGARASAAGRVQPALSLGLDQRQVAAGRPIEYCNSRGLGIEEHDALRRRPSICRGRVADRHRPDGLPLRLEDLGTRARARAAARLGGVGLRDLLGVGASSARPALAALELAFDLPGLLPELVDRLRLSAVPRLVAARRSPCRNFSPRAWSVTSARWPVFSRETTTCAETAASLSIRSSLPSLRFDDPANAGSDVDLTSSELESHSGGNRSARREQRAG